MSDITYNKPHLSEQQKEQTGTSGNRIAINCTSQGQSSASAINCTPHSLEHLSKGVDDLVRQSLASNTRRAYASDLSRYEAWGGGLPATKETIAAYLADHAESHCPATITRWLASLAKAHKSLEGSDPTKSELVKSVLRGIRRRRVVPPKQARPLTRDILFDILEAIPGDLRGVRDKALLLVGFAGGFRRSELVGLEVSDMAPHEKGMILTLRRSKTDQTGRGRAVGVPYARGRFCAVHALSDWIEAAKIENGPAFRSINRHGLISQQSLSAHAVSQTIKQRLRQADMDPLGFSGHSLRSGFVTSAARAGVSSWKIRQQTGHASDAMLQRYIRDTEVFENNAAGALL